MSLPRLPNLLLTTTFFPSLLPILLHFVSSNRGMYSRMERVLTCSQNLILNMNDHNIKVCAYNR